MYVCKQNAIKFQSVYSDPFPQGFQKRLQRWFVNTCLRKWPWISKVVSHSSTNQSQPCLTLRTDEIRLAWAIRVRGEVWLLFRNTQKISYSSSLPALTCSVKIGDSALMSTCHCTSQFVQSQINGLPTLAQQNPYKPACCGKDPFPFFHQRSFWSLQWSSVDWSMSVASGHTHRISVRCLTTSTVTFPENASY